MMLPFRGTAVRSTRGLHNQAGKIGKDEFTVEVNRKMADMRRFGDLEKKTRPGAAIKRGGLVSSSSQFWTATLLPGLLPGKLRTHPMWVASILRRAVSSIERPEKHFEDEDNRQNTNRNTDPADRAENFIKHRRSPSIVKISPKGRRHSAKGGLQ
jgi:hypothetical protein